MPGAAAESHVGLPREVEESLLRSMWDGPLFAWQDMCVGDMGAAESGDGSAPAQSAQVVLVSVRRRSLTCDRVLRCFSSS